MSKKTKTKKEKAALKASGIIFAIIIFFSILMAIGNSSESAKSIESISLSVPNYQEEYDILTEIPVEISVSPKDADDSSLEYIASGKAISFSESGILTGTQEGTYTVFVKSENILSNSILITVVDSSDQNAGKEKSEEEENEEWARRTSEVAQNNAKIKETYTSYVLNTSTFKIHFPSCDDVDKIDSENYATSDLSREELEDQGYTVCGHCFKD